MDLQKAQIGTPGSDSGPANPELVKRLVQREIHFPARDTGELTTEQKRARPEASEMAHLTVKEKLV
jgi:hypothetical protein